MMNIQHAIYPKTLAAAAVLASLTAFAADGQAAIKDQIVGAWSLVSNTEDYENMEQVVWGPDVRGMLILDADGHYSFQMGVGGRPMSKGNPAEDPKGKYMGYFGNYEIDETNKTLILKIERSTSANFDGKEQLRTIVSLDDDNMTYKAVKSIPGKYGPFIPTLVWKRYK
jgi:Lipocalin-like domain